MEGPLPVKIEIVATGPLHERPTQALKKAAKRAMDDTAAYALGLLRARTPVRTGLMRGSWYVESRGWDQFYFDNSVPYAQFVDQRVLITSRSRPEIQNHLAESLATSIERDLN